MLRVLFVNENLGGHAAMHAYLRRALVRHPEIEATFFDVPAPNLWRRLVAAPVPGLARLDADLQPLRYQLAQSWHVQRRLVGLLSRADVVHVYTHNAVLLSSHVLRRLPTVVSLDTTNAVNAFHIEYRRPGPLTAASLRAVVPFERRVYEAATIVVAQSEWTAKPLELYGVETERVRIIPFGVTVPELKQRPPSVELPRVTFVGKTMETKGGWNLVRVFEESLRDRCRLTLVTREAVRPRPGIEVLSDIRPGDGRLTSVLADTAVFAFPTRVDKVPYAVLEAMATGVAVVSTRVGAIPEMVEHGVTGLLVEPGDDAALASALRALLHDTDRRRAMGDAGRRRVLQRFDARHTTAELVRVLAEAHGRGAVAPRRSLGLSPPAEVVTGTDVRRPAADCPLSCTGPSPLPWRMPPKGPDWAAGSRSLEAGAGPEEVCRAARLPPAFAARLVPRWAAAWVDLLDDLDGCSVLVADHAPGWAPARLAERGASVTLVDDQPLQTAFRRTLLAAGANVAAGTDIAAVPIGAASAARGSRSRWDVIVADGLRLGASGMRSLTMDLAPGGRVVVVSDNVMSPLRAFDARLGCAVGPVGGAGSGWNAALTGAGLAVRQSFVLLRSSAAPVTAFDVAAPRASRAVLQAAATRVRGNRRRGLRLLERTLGGRLNIPAVPAVLAPARLVVATSASAPWELASRRITGRIGYDDSVESKVLRGEPPAEVEKRYASVREAAGEAAALRALADAGLAIAPRVLARPAPDRLCVSWLTGRPLEVAALDDGQLEAWIRRAGTLLAVIQRATGADGQGRVLVHGDYWLGNLLYEGDRIVGVVDWTTAGWGQPETDLAHLVASLPKVRPTSPRLMERLTRVARQGFEAESAASLG